MAEQLGSPRGLRPEKTSLSGVACPSQTNCSVVYPSVPGAISATTDGGARWTKRSVPTGTDGLSGVSCPSATQCVAVANFNGQILLTDDGGKEWTQPTSSPSGIDYSAVACPTTSDCFAGGSVYVSMAGENFTDILSSTDGRETWSTPQSFPVVAGQLNGIACQSMTDCFAVGSGVAEGGGPAGIVVATTDGSSWSTQTLPPDVSELDAVACPVSGPCFAVGLNASAGGLILSNT